MVSSDDRKWKRYQLLFEDEMALVAVSDEKLYQ